MYKIIIAAHGTLSDGLVDAAELIMGGTEEILAYNLKQGDDIQEFGSKISTALDNLEADQAAIILTDLVGASPYNQAIMAVDSLTEDAQANCFVLSGVNLPMVLEALILRDEDLSLQTAVDSMMTAARKNLLVEPLLEDV